MNHLVLDLEMCKVPKVYRGKNYRYATEIIQIGAVLLDEAYEVIGRLNQYVHPQYGVIDHYIANLTGIDNKNVKNAPALDQALKYMLSWIGEREYKVYAWSNTDYAQLSHEIACKKIEDDRIGCFMEQQRWIDYQDVFGKRFRFERKVSLEEALSLCNISVDGKLHDGLDDAFNTTKIIKELETNDTFEIYDYKSEISTESCSLNFNLGDLFAGLQIECFA